MAFSKEDLYEPEEVLTTLYFRAMGHSARRRILKRLRRDGILCVLQLADEHPITRETLSQHLRILREAQLVECEEKYPFTFYWINEENLEEAIKCCMWFFESLGIDKRLLDGLRGPERNQHTDVETGKSSNRESQER